MKRITKGLLGLAGLAAIAAPMMPAHADPAISFSNDFEDAIVSAGSDTTYFALNALANTFNESDGCALNSITYPKAPADPAFHSCKPPASQSATVVKTENYDHEYAYNQYPQGSSAGVRLLCQQKAPRAAGVPFISFARSSSGPSSFGATHCGNASVESGLTLRFVAFAKDALSWAYWTGQSPAPATDLTQAQLNDIFVDCTINNWNQIGGEDHPIEVWSVQSASGTRATWDSFVGGASDNCIPAAFKNGNPADGERVIFENDANPILNDPASLPGTGSVEKYAIYFFSVGVFNANVSNQAGATLGSVNGFAPTTVNIQSGDFPFSRFLYNVYRQTAAAPTLSPPTANFVGNNGWLCKGSGSHSKPTSDPNPGIPSASATKNWNTAIENGIQNNGFILIRTSGNRCNVTDKTFP